MPIFNYFGIWTGLAFNIIILLAGLRNIDPEHFKIAKMFGATEKENFLENYIPSISSNNCVLIYSELIGAFKVYTQVYALFGGTAGVANSATTAVLLYLRTSSMWLVVQGLRWQQL